MAEVALDHNSRIQVLPTLSSLGSARRNQMAAFIKDKCSLVVWSDDVGTLIDDAAELNRKFVEGQNFPSSSVTNSFSNRIVHCVWENRHSNRRLTGSSGVPGSPGSLTFSQSPSMIQLFQGGPTSPLTTVGGVSQADLGIEMQNKLDQRPVMLFARAYLPLCKFFDPSFST